MKKIAIVILFILLGIGVGIFSIPGIKNPLKALSLTQITPLPSHLSPSTPQKLAISQPATIAIPKLGVSAKVESVSKDSKGNMDVPSNYINTAWYSPGPKPGEKGSAVIDGHVDTPQGTPSVFAKLDTLSKGDQITIKSATGHQYTFIVSDVIVYPLSTIPLEHIFDRNTSEKRLNLITCSGVWDKNSKTYSERLVVYSKILE